VLFSEPKIPQSQDTDRYRARCAARFSALQRAENSSILTGKASVPELIEVSVLFSEPKIPQSQPQYLE